MEHRDPIISTYPNGEFMGNLENIGDECIARTCSAGLEPIGSSVIADYLANIESIRSDQLGDKYNRIAQIRKPPEGCRGCYFGKYSPGGSGFIHVLNVL